MGDVFEFLKMCTAGFIIITIPLAIGWSLAHAEVARECERQGSFYVGKTTYYCASIKPTQGAENE